MWTTPPDHWQSTGIKSLWKKIQRKKKKETPHPQIFCHFPNHLTGIVLAGHCRSSPYFLEERLAVPMVCSDAGNSSDLIRFSSIKSPWLIKPSVSSEDHTPWWTLVFTPCQSPQDFSLKKPVVRGSFSRRSSKTLQFWSTSAASSLAPARLLCFLHWI